MSWIYSKTAHAAIRERISELLLLVALFCLFCFVLTDYQTSKYCAPSVVIACWRSTVQPWDNPSECALTVKSI